MNFNAKSFLREQFQTPQNTISQLEAYRMSAPTLAAAAKWFQRGSIPGDYVPLLFAVVEIEHGRPISVVQYIE